MTTRRDMLKAAAVAPLAFVPISNVDAMKASLHATAALENAGLGAPYVPKFFKPDEWQALRILVDLIIPRDARSGSATEAGVPEFMDFMLGEYASMRTWMRRCAVLSRSFANQASNTSVVRIVSMRAC